MYNLPRIIYESDGDYRLMCRVGMTTNPSERRRYWESQHPGLRNWRVLVSGLTYDEAQARERREAQRRGCEAEEGGPRVPGRVWSVYYFEF